MAPEPYRAWADLAMKTRMRQAPCNFESHLKSSLLSATDGCLLARLWALELTDIGSWC